jgi:hypothetical protein
MRGARYESWQQYRQRMLDETSRFIEWGLRHPELIIEIPVKPADNGGFPAGVGRWFWLTVLCDRPTGTIRRWRDFLLHRPKGFLHRNT